jgi:hypothetical protein
VAVLPFEGAVLPFEGAVLLSEGAVLLSEGVARLWLAEPALAGCRKIRGKFPYALSNRLTNLLRQAGAKRLAIERNAVNDSNHRTGQTSDYAGLYIMRFGMIYQRPRDQLLKPDARQFRHEPRGCKDVSQHQTEPFCPKFRVRKSVGSAIPRRQNHPPPPAPRRQKKSNPIL